MLVSGLTPFTFPARYKGKIQEKFLSIYTIFPKTILFLKSNCILSLTSHNHASVQYFFKRYEMLSFLLKMHTQTFNMYESIKAIPVQAVEALRIARG
jgi:hypothetical protein